MANRRMIAKTISTSKKVNRLSNLGKLVYTWLIPHCDDYGRMEGDAQTVKAIVVPMVECSVDEVQSCLDEMRENKLIEIYFVDDETYLEIVNFSEFQTFKNDRSKWRKYPDIPKDSNGIQRIPTSQVKSSQVKSSEVNILAASKESAESKRFQELIYLFKDVNPSYQRLYSNKTQRAALDRLVKQHGFEKMEGTVVFLQKLIGKPYAPQITTPVQLEEKLGKLIAYVERRRNEIKGQTKTIIGL